MEDITKRQLFLLLLLVSVVTGVSSAIIVYSLLEQAPPPLTNIIQRVIKEATVQDSAKKETLSPEIVFDLEKAALARDTLIEDISKRLSPAVVSVIATKDVPVVEQVFINPFSDDQFFNDFFRNFSVPQLKQRGTERRQVSSGSGFFVSSDGYLITNRHVVEDTKADYSVVMNNGKSLSAKVLARDPLHDVAILKVEGSTFSFAPLGNSSSVNIGQTAIAIGNSLGEFQNTVSAGIISGVRRTIVARGAPSGPEELANVIQTDAAINPGNSGGPLLNLRGEVIGVNTAIAQGAENIGFAIPINQIKKALDDVKKTGKIQYPFLGVRHVLVTTELQEKNKLPVSYGAQIIKGPNGEPGVVSGSPAEKGGLQEGDIILEFGGVPINADNPLNDLIYQKNAGDTVRLKVLRDTTELFLNITLEERKWQN